MTHNINYEGDTVTNIIGYSLLYYLLYMYIYYIVNETRYLLSLVVWHLIPAGYSICSRSTCRRDFLVNDKVSSLALNHSTKNNKLSQLNKLQIFLKLRRRLLCTLNHEKKNWNEGMKKYHLHRKYNYVLRDVIKEDQDHFDLGCIFYYSVVP